MQIKKKILIPIVIVILFLLGITIYSIYNIQQKNYTDAILDKIKEIEYIFQRSLNSEGNMLASHIYYLKKDTTILQAYENKDKEGLYNYCLPIFEEIKSKYRITHFYFIDTTGTCFLRVHNKLKNGDTIKRFTFEKAKQTSESFYGIELGTFGTFTLRYVSPVIIDNKIVYYIELGMEIEHITPQIKEIVGTDLALLIEKKFTSQEKWEMGLEMFAREGNWNEFKNYIVIDKTINERFDFEKLSKIEKNKLENISSKDNLYKAGAIPLIDASDRTLGKIIIFEEISDKQKTIERIMAFLIGISFITLVILLLFFFKYISKIENNINITYNKLDNAKQQSEKDKEKIQNKNNELTAADEELRQNNEELFALNENINEANHLVVEKNKIIEKSHKNITDSINYAKTIQEALLTKKELIDTYLNEHFIFFRPKEQVSGDFYYINKVENKIIIAIADCTGHGVPGGFITMLGITYLHEIVRRREAENPGEVLDILRTRIKEIFKTSGSQNQNGLDIAFCSINTETNTLQYAGAYNPLVIIRNNKIIEYKATRNPIGYYPKEIKFKNNIILIQKGDVIYLFSDGFHDQVGEVENEKFMSRNFKNLLLKNHKLPMEEQKQLLNIIFNNWKGDRQQMDDVLVMGVKL